MVRVLISHIKKGLQFCRISRKNSDDKKEISHFLINLSIVVINKTIKIILPLFFLALAGFFFAGALVALVTTTFLRGLGLTENNEKYLIKFFHICTTFSSFTFHYTSSMLSLITCHFPCWGQNMSWFIKT